MYVVEKPWGQEEVLEINDNYMVKRLTMKAGHQCSLQRHYEKKETFVVLSGQMEFQIENAEGVVVPIIMEAGQFFTINPGVKHRMKAITHLIYMETSTPHPNDVERLEDDYERIDSN